MTQCHAFAQSTRIPSEVNAVVLEAVQSPYQAIEIRNHPIYGNQLVIDGDLQISESDHAYNHAMVSPLIPLGDVRNVAILGGGDGGVLNEVLQTSERMEWPLENAFMVEIDSKVIEMSKKHLKRLCAEAFEHPKSEVIVGDALSFLDHAPELDAVIYDLTMEPVRQGQPRQEFIAEIVERIAGSVRSGGVLSMQCCGDGMGDPRCAEENRELLSEIETYVGSRFSDLVEQQVMIPSYHELWTFLVATRI